MTVSATRCPMKLMLALGMSALLLSTDVESSLSERLEVQPARPSIFLTDDRSVVQLSRVYIDFGIHAPIGRHGRVDLYFGGPGYYHSYPRHYRHRPYFRHHPRFHHRHHYYRHHYRHHRDHFRPPHRFKHRNYGRPHAWPDDGPPRHHWKRHHKDRYYRNHHVTPRHPHRH